jgi:hypothetical protein
MDSRNPFEKNESELNEKDDSKDKNFDNRIKNDNENNDEKNQGFEQIENLNSINNINNEINLLNKKRERMNKLVKNPNHYKIIKRIRNIILNSIIIFINKMIKIIYNNDIMKGIRIKQFLPIDKSNLSHSTVEYNKIFLHKKLKEILSEKINDKYTNFPKNKNKLLIEDLIKSDKGGTYFKKIFDLTFLDCVEHIRGTKNFVELNGLMDIDEMLNSEEFKIDKNNIDDFESAILFYEEIINTKKSRIQKKKLNNL